MNLKNSQENKYQEFINKKYSKFLILKKFMKFEILSFIPLSKIIRNLLYIDKRTKKEIKDYKPFKILIDVFELITSEIDFSVTKEENVLCLKNLCFEENLLDQDINYSDIAVFLKLLEFKDQESLSFYCKYNFFTPCLRFC